MGCHGYQHRDRWSAAGQPVLTPEERERLEDAALDLRVSHAERQEVVDELARHYAAGRLTVEEYEERVAGAFAARTGRDFVPLLADLPEDRPAPVATRPSGAPAGSGLADVIARYWPRVSRRALVVAVVVVLAILTEGWVLWLMIPAWIIAGKHRLYERYPSPRPPSRHHGSHRPATQWM
jgi:hypothetical protein